MKRYRDERGALTVRLSDLRKLTAEEGKAYYTTGNTYLNMADLREYALDQVADGIAEFKSVDGHELNIPVDNIGTFLPDVASAGLELVKL